MLSITYVDSCRTRVVKVLFDIDMPIRTVGEYLLRWGYTPQRPIKRALEQNPVKVEQWMNETYPTIAARAKAEGAVIYWGDETAVAEDGHWLRSGVRVERPEAV